jgi:hypothetical protein
MLPPPSREYEPTCKCMITDVVYSKIMRSFDNYERNTGQRHPMQPEVVNKRAVGNVLLIDDDKDHEKELWYGTLDRLRD